MAASNAVSSQNRERSRGAAVNNQNMVVRETGRMTALENTHEEK
jgi:hypothetical protein